MSESEHATELVAEASATATHPEGTVVDENGHPVLDADGQPITKEENES